jgi:hypothetical protein
MPAHDLKTGVLMSGDGAAMSQATGIPDVAWEEERMVLAINMHGEEIEYIRAMKPELHIVTCALDDNRESGTIPRWRVLGFSSQYDMQISRQSNVIVARRGSEAS